MTALLHPLELREPWFLLAALAAVPVFLLARRVGGRVTFSSLRLLPAGARTWRVRLAFVPPALLGLAALALGVAVAGPRIGDQRSRIQKKGIAVMMAVDISGSMQALDLSEGGKERTRLDAIQEVFRAFVLGGGKLAGRPDDAIGLISFAGHADCRVPLTLDHENLVRLADGLEIVTERKEDGTALGDGLDLAVARLRESKAASKVVILLTDGVNNTGVTAPLAAAELARAEGIKVYTIGAGTNGLAPVRVTDPFTGAPRLTRMPVEIDERTLQAIAEATGGRYFRATNAEALREVYAAIDGLERSEHEETRFARYHELFPHATAAGLLLAAVAWLLGATVFRRLP